MLHKTSIIKEKKLEKDFYLRDVTEVAKSLIGKVLVKRISDENYIAGEIVETEAYNGAEDAASHSYKGKTQRNEIMFEQGGILYVYFIYGVHYCANVVTGKRNFGSAVLLRGISPLTGIDIMLKNRDIKKKLDNKNLTNGPAKICQAFNISKKDNGKNLLGNEFFLIDYKSYSSKKIITSKRIGIKKSTDLLWRFYLSENKYISKL